MQPNFQKYKSVPNRKATLPKPTRIIYINDGSVYYLFWEILNSQIKYLIEWMRALVIVALLVIISSGIGIYAYRIATLPLLTFEQVMIAIFRLGYPDSSVIRLALLSGLITFLINMKIIFRQKTVESVSVFTRILAGIVIVSWLDLYWLNMSPFRLWIGLEPLATNRNIEIFTAQVVTIGLALLMMPICAKMVRVHIWQFPIRNNPIPASFSHLLRFLFIVGAIIVININIMKVGLPPNLLSIVLLVFLAIASVFYWAPGFRKVRSFGTIRVILFLIAFLCCGWIFQNLPSIQGYVNVVIVSAVFSVVAIPVQRLFS